MKKLLVAALFSAASLAQAGPLTAATAEAESSSLMHRLTQQAQGLSSRAGDVVFSAMAKLDVPYRLGGNSRDTGFDCSGLVHAVYKQTLGLVLPRRAAEQASSTQKIAKDELRPGDLVFFNTMRRSYSHVGIYIGDNKFIHAPRTGARVRVENMDINYWRSRFDGARRVTAQSGEFEAPRLASAYAPSQDASAYQLTASDASSRSDTASLALQLAAAQEAGQDIQAAAVNLTEADTRNAVAAPASPAVKRAEAIQRAEVKRTETQRAEAPRTKAAGKAAASTSRDKARSTAKASTKSNAKADRQSAATRKAGSVKTAAKSSGRKV
ncbi:C40 family peptidase [Comamonas serinivorans]|uniref:C40 family peptidase n=1 Tax=Comamonas serinivorans TaxID=1082851 RepID=UPI00196B9A39